MQKDFQIYCPPTLKFPASQSPELGLIGIEIRLGVNAIKKGLVCIFFKIEALEMDDLEKNEERK